MKAIRKQLPISEHARSFLEALLVDAGMQIVPPSIRETMLIDLAKRLDVKLTLAAMDALPSDKIAGFEALLESKASAQKLSRYLQKNVPDIGKVYADALIQFRQAYLIQ